jgi:hypothetical protein
VDALTVRLLVGPDFASYKLKEKIPFFQVVSATDTRFQRGVSAVTVRTTKTEPVGPVPPGWAGPRFDKHLLDVRLPPDRAMARTHKYWIRVSSYAVMGPNRKAAWIQTRTTSKTDVAPRYGIREFYVLSPRALHVVTGPGLDLKRLGDPRNVCVTSRDDPDFGKPVSPRAIGRRSNLDFCIPTGRPWHFAQRHELFLLLPQTLENGRTYTLNLNARAGAPVTCGEAPCDADARRPKERGPGDQGEPIRLSPQRPEQS